ncbi:MAG: phosphatidylethanolamine N-methyltransferase family protein, partial [Desulfurococcales archaeon]|nr:phosphatidylethanolamine N-methyltransferase family protein [Desulfurococcales archaeon]
MQEGSRGDGGTARIIYAWRALYWLVLDLSPFILGRYCCHGCGDLGSPMIVYAAIILGVVLIIYGVVLNIVAGRTLRLYGHRGRVPRFTPPDRLVDRGIYSCMRHP